MVRCDINVDDMLESIDKSFNITPWLLIVPGVVIFLIIRKTEPLIALMLGTLLGGLFAVIFQPHIIENFAKIEKIDFHSAYKVVMNAITTDISIETSNPRLNDLFSSGGMSGMLGTIWLILSAMVIRRYNGGYRGIGCYQQVHC